MKNKLLISREGKIKKITLLVLAVLSALMLFAFCACAPSGGGGNDDNRQETYITADYESYYTLEAEDDLDAVKAHLTVRYYDEDGERQIVTDYTLSGTLTPGQTSTITVTYQGKTTTFTVKVNEPKPKKQYTITFKNGSNVVEKVTYYEGDTKITEPEVPEKTGYIGSWGEYDLTSGNQTVLAVYTAKTYEITLDYQGATGGNERQTLTVTYGYAIGELPTPVRNGWEFMGWFYKITEDGEEWQAGSSSNWYDDCEATFKAHWAPHLEETQELYFSPDMGGSNWGWYVNGLDGPTLTNVYIPTTHEGRAVREIRSLGFCNNVKNLYFGSGIKKVARLFDFGSDCAIENIYFTGTLADWCEIDFYQYGIAGRYDLNLYMRDDVFSEYKKVTDLVIPEGVKGIEMGQFWHINVTSAVLPESVQVISDGAFGNCRELTSVTVNGDLSAIGWQSFYGCAKLNSITLNGKVGWLGSNAFQNCSSLESITLPDGVASFADHSFSGCGNLTEIRIGNGLTRIGEDAFDGCTKLATVNFNGTFAEWCKIAFGSEKANPMCSAITLNLLNASGKLEKLTAVAVPEGSTSVGAYQFYGFGALTSITIPDSVTSIGAYAFGNCSSSSLKSYNGAKYVGNVSNPYHALVNCTSGATVTVHVDTKLIADAAFKKNAIVTAVTVPDGVASIGAEAFYNCTSLETVTVGNGVESIGASAFYGCSKLKTINMGNGVKSVGSSAFYNCKGLEYNAYDNALYLGNEEKPYLVLVKATETTITSCDIHEDCAVIYYSAFDGCTSLESVILGANVKEIGEYAFFNCYNMTTLTMNKGIVGIGAKAFEKCRKLTTVNFNGTLTDWCKISFADGTSNPGHLYLSDGESGEYVKLTDVVIPEEITSIGNYQFYFSLKTIKIHTGVTHIGDSALYGGERALEITFEGTIEQLKAVEKGKYWTTDERLSITCSDGSILVKDSK